MDPLRLQRVAAQSPPLTRPGRIRPLAANLVGHDRRSSPGEKGGRGQLTATAQAAGPVGADS